MCYVGKATKIFIFIVTALVVIGLILGFGLFKHAVHRPHNCSGDLCHSSTPQFPNPNPIPASGANPYSPTPILTPNPFPPPAPDPGLYPPPADLPPNPVVSPPPPDVQPQPPPPPPVQLTPLVAASPNTSPPGPLVRSTTPGPVQA